jgi:protein PhnA
MSIEKIVLARAEGKCELCGAETALTVHDVEKAAHKLEGAAIAICEKCTAQILKKEELDASHWRCLGTSMWSEVPGVQVTAWRMLNRLRTESWAAEHLDMLYLDEEKLEWAKATGDHENDGSVELHRDAFGAVLQNGDTVVLTKSLDVKGSTVNARVGTVVRNIRLVESNKEQIEGRIEGQLIVILTKYLRKQHS